MSNDVATSLNWLKSKCINVPTDWLEACVDWVKTENQGQLQQARLQELILEQWLLADLREIGSKCLPQNIGDQKCELRGIYTLQVEGIVDVSQSCYSQMQKIQGNVNNNVSVSAEASDQKPWEPKASRMLILHLTDGTVNVKAMEYKPITNLNPKLPMGSKVLIEGPLLCRRGMMMLKAENLTVLGGEVDTLVETNTPIQLLQQALERNLQSTNSSQSTKFSGKYIKRKDVNSSFGSSSQSKPTFTGNRVTTHSYSNPVNLSGLNQSNFTERYTSGKRKNNVKEEVDEWGDDDFPIDDALFDDPIEDNYGNNNTMVNASFESSKPIYVTKENISSNRSNNNNTRNIERAQQLTSASSSVTIPQRHKTEAQQGSDFDAEGDKFDFEDEMFEEDMDMEFDDISEGMNTVPDASLSNKRKQPPACDDVIMPSCCNLNKKVTATELSSGEHSLSKHHREASVECKPGDNLFCVKVEKVEETQTSTSLTNSYTSVRPKYPAHSEEKRDNSSEENKSRGYSSVKDKPSVIVSPLSHQKITDHANTESKLNVHSKPYTYLSVINKALASHQGFTCTVKAYISTLVSKLDSSGGKEWTLDCKINDGTAAINVSLSSQVLDTLIGFTAPKSVEMRKRMKKEPDLKRILAEGLQQCQRKLIELSCLMDIQFTSPDTKPCVIAVRQMNDQDFILLQDRLNAAENCQ